MIPITPITSLSLMLQTSFTSAQAQLMPLILIALVLDFTIVVLWYLIGVLISNASVRQSALGELYQFVSTAILVLLIVAVLYIAATIFTQTFSGGPLGVPAISAMCSSIKTAPDFLTPGALLSNPIDICGLVSNPQQTGVTSEIDYPLAASGVVTSDLGYQMGVNLNSTYILDSYVRFLTKLNPTWAICLQSGPAQAIDAAGFQQPIIGQVQAPGGWVIPEIGGKAPCTPIPTDMNYSMYIKFSSAPYSGYDMISGSIGTLATLMSTALGVFIAEGVSTSMMLFVWPWMLFAGILFRATPFTRRLGGLLIAIAIGAVLIYPTLFAMELIAVSGTSANVFNFPNVQSIANTDGCWPAGGSLFLQEASDVFYLASFGAPFSLIWNLATGVGQGGPLDWAFIYSPKGFIPLTCQPSQAVQTVFDLFNAYGALGTVGFFLPILNLIITLSAIRALSGLLGGDVDLAGLSKLF